MREEVFASTCVLHMQVRIKEAPPSVTGFLQGMLERLSPWARVTCHKQTEGWGRFRQAGEDHYTDFYTSWEILSHFRLD
jgi:hypothetical protein